MEQIPCGCGCGEMIPRKDKHGNKRKYATGHQYRVPLSPERIAILRERKLGKKLSPAHSAAIAASLKGRQFSLQHLVNLGAAQHKHSKLTASNVRTIRRLWDKTSQTEDVKLRRLELAQLRRKLSDKYGVPEWHIVQVAKRETWKTI